MSKSIKKFEKIGIAVPEILLPNENVDLKTWPVIACDQYTSQPEYWEKVDDIVGNAPSTLKMVLPEIFLNGKDFEDRIHGINANMSDYLEQNILESKGEGFVLVERNIGDITRLGVVVAADLEAYDYNEGSQSLIRATEGTVIDRLPPRMKIRKNASVETPHIMLLIDDCDCMIDRMHDNAAQGKYNKIYDTDLMLNGGKVKGWIISDDQDINAFASHLEALSENASMLFAVGDGNHSLASAKCHWEEVKKTLGDNWEDHPARYALVEVVNIHDKGLEFEPIHRVIFNCDYKDMLANLEAFVVSVGGTFEVKYFAGVQAQNKMKSHWHKIEKMTGCQKFAFVNTKVCGIVVMTNTNFRMAVGTIQAFIDGYLEKHRECEVDYIHGEDVVCALSSEEFNTGILLPNMDKSELFPAVIHEGALPRKTFSMGEANEKRYYMECRKITY